MTSVTRGSPVLPEPRAADGAGPQREDRIRLRAASSRAPRIEDAVAEAAAALGDEADLYLAFVPDQYDTTDAAPALTRWAGSRLVACTSAGGIGPAGFEPDALVVVALSGPDMTVRTIPIAPLGDLQTAWTIATNRLATALQSGVGAESFAVLLVDGLSMAEEDLVDGLLARLGDEVPVIGGSASDALRFRRSEVLVEGRFVPDAATLTIVSTSAPFRPMRVQHHVSGDSVLVVTRATPRDRVVHELNGRPAAVEYAQALGLSPDRLTPEVFSAHPFVIRAGGAEWVRSVSRVEPDDSLRFLCAADRGTVLRVAHGTDPVTAVDRAFAEVRDHLGTVGGALVFDGVQRRLEFEAAGTVGDIGRLLVRHGAAGFSTFGEQYGGVHVNQTMVGIVFGA